MNPIDIEIGTEVTFDAAHSLPGYDGKCSELHGHTWRVKVKYSILNMYAHDIPTDGMLIDFARIKSLITDRFDHKHLNDLMMMPTAENVALRIVAMMPLLRGLRYILNVIVWESAVSYIKVGRYFNVEGDDD